MAKIYISSTFSDLKEYREAVYHILRKMRHDVIAMEDYVAADQRPLNECLQDVAACDLYVGIFAWRYGYIPKKDNPARKSITELEYRQANEMGKPCLIFLLDEEAAWSRAWMDEVTGEGNKGTRIAALRQELGQERLVSFFKAPDQLASLVSAAVALAVTAEPVTRVSQSVSELAEANVDVSQWMRGLEEAIEPEWYDRVLTSELPAIMEPLRRLETAKLIEVNLGHGDAWWSTRLYLLAALAADYTQIRQLIFTDHVHRLIGMASPAATRHALGAIQPILERAYRNSLPGPEARAASVQDDVASTAENFQSRLSDLVPGGEADLKVWVTQPLLEGWLGRQLSAESIETANQPLTALLLYRIIDRSAPFVALVHDRKLVQVIDRQELAVRVASDYLAQQLQ